MATVLKGIVCGDKKTGKTSLMDLLGERTQGKTYDIELVDPTSHSQIKFCIDETLEMPKKFRPVCVFLVYSLASNDTFESVKAKWFPLVQSSINLTSSFVIIVGTHSDCAEREVESCDAEEFAAGSGAFHMEVSCKSKRNIELMLKLLRIRAFYLIKKHPELKFCDEETSASPLTSINTSNSLSHDIPLPYKDFSSLQMKRHQAEEAERRELIENIFEESLDRYRKTNEFEDKNMSFADMIDYDELQELSEDSLNEQIKEISIDTLGSPSWQQKIPPLSIHSKNSSGGFPQTERSHESHNAFLSSGSSTERNRKDPLLLLEIQLEKSLKKVEVFKDDTSLSIAERVLGPINPQILDKLSNIIEKAINDYISQVRLISMKKPLYKVKIAIGNKAGEIVIYDGDSLENVAKDYVKSNNIPKQYEQQILKLLIEAGEKFYSQ